MAEREIEIIDFSQHEADLMADILQGAFQIADLVGGQRDSLNVFGEFIDALNSGNTIRIQD